MRATIASFRQHVPKPQPSDIAELVAVLKEYVASRPRQSPPRGRRRAASGGRPSGTAMAGEMAANRSPSLPALSSRRGAETAPAGAKPDQTVLPFAAWETFAYCHGGNITTTTRSSSSGSTHARTHARTHAPARPHTRTHARAHKHTHTARNFRKDEWHRLALERDDRDVRADMCVGARACAGNM